MAESDDAASPMGIRIALERVKKQRATPGYVWKAQPDEAAVAKLALKPDDVRRLTEQWGPNKLPDKVVPWYELLSKQFKGPMPGMIMVAIFFTVITFRWADCAVCAFMLSLNAFLGFKEESHAQAAAQALKEQSKERVEVFRGSNVPKQLPAEELVPGDIVQLKAGNKVPADCQWLFGKTAVCSEAALTGESIDVNKGGEDGDFHMTIALVGDEDPLTNFEKSLGVELNGLKVDEVGDDGPAREAEDSPQNSNLKLTDRYVCMVNDVEVSTREELERAISDRPRELRVVLSSRDLLGGAMIKKCTKCYAIVEKTGERSMLGVAAKMASSGPTKGEFQSAIEFMVKWVIGTTLVITAVCVFWQTVIHNIPVMEALVGAIALCIGSVPVALPVVLTVTQALGASMMAEVGAIVTNLRAMQEIAVMQVLCSDKTGTLTTAEMVIYVSHTKVFDSQMKKTDVLKFAALAADAKNIEDPIDKCVIAKFREKFPEPGGVEPVDVFQKQELRDWKIVKYVGFSSDTKRTTVFVEHMKTGQKYVIGKGILSKIINTLYVGNEIGDMDDGVQWKCVNAELRESADCVIEDTKLARSGYKTISICAQELDAFPDFSKKEQTWKLNGKPMKLVGILPMQDPPRADSKEVIQAIRDMGVRVKMITGDHTNIAIETAKQIALGENIKDRKQLLETAADGTKVVNPEVVKSTDGFAQVLPIDKSAIVKCLQKDGMTVGMTGDGANDAAALGSANVGIAVEGAVDSARAASDILLTEGGLKPIQTAIVESRKIFQRLRSYVIYRVAHTIHVVLTLTHLILHHNITLHPMYVIVMALFNDLAITMIGYDNAKPTEHPSVPKVFNMLVLAFVMGFVQSIGTALVFETGLKWLLSGNLHSADLHLTQNNEYMQTVMYLQMATTAGMLIFQARTPHFVFSTNPAHINPPGRALVTAVCVPCMFATYCAYSGLLVREKVSAFDVGRVWMYNLVLFMFIEAAKLTVVYFFPEEVRHTELLTGRKDAGVQSFHLARQDSVRGRESFRRYSSTLQGREQQEELRARQKGAARSARGAATLTTGLLASQ